MKELFVSDKCIDCINLKNEDGFNERFSDFEIVNITESMTNLKRFLKYRDSLDEYKTVRENNKVGVPSTVIVGKIVEIL